MTNSDQQKAGKQGTSTLPFDPADLTRGIRVRPAQFARMCNVSKQTVSVWIKQGKITLYTDGTLDPAKAAESVVRNTDPSRLRAKVFRVANDEISQLRRSVAALAHELAESKSRIEYLERATSEAERAEQNLLLLLVLAQARLSDTDAAEYPITIEELSDLSWLIAGGYEPLPGDAGEVENYLAYRLRALNQVKGGGEVEITLPTPDEIAFLNTSDATLPTHDEIANLNAIEMLNDNDEMR